MPRRPIKIDSYVWCDRHGEIHAAKADFYQEAELDPYYYDDENQCLPANWRQVYVLGEKGEEF